MKEELLDQLGPFGQQHLLAFWDRLDASQRAELARQIHDLDLALIDRLFRGEGCAVDVHSLAARARSPRAFRLDGSGNLFTPDEARERGAESLAAGEVGVVLVAGGQGTRLGFDHPKGMHPIGPVSGKTLFQIHFEKVRAAARRCGADIPVYVMTSPATDEETRRYLADQNRFGLAEEDVFLFCQGTMPAVDAETGKVLLAEPHCLALSPDGHGGMVAAFSRSGALEAAQGRGIRHLFYFQVDNPLVDVCGREFLGYHLLSGSGMSTQVIAKRDPLERVGNVVDVDGRLHVIEYSDLPEDVARRRNPDGSLAIWAGSIAVHAIDLGFLARMVDRADAMPFHVARKKVNCVDLSGRRIAPEESNAIKFERFIFDLLPEAAGAIVVEVDPRLAFAPLKNAPGAEEDTPEAVRARLSALYAGWLRACGVEVAADVPVEISPLFAMDAEELAQKVQPGRRIDVPTYLGVVS